MLRREAVAALRAYTRLPEPVQGLFEQAGDLYQVSGTLSNDRDFDRVMARASLDMFCLSTLRVMGSPTDLLGEAAGAFLVRGRVVRLATGIYGIVSVVQGEVPPPLRSAANTYFVTLRDEDRVQCAAPPLIPFGTATTLQPLAPGWPYLAALYEKRLTHCVVACANGLFVLRTLLQSASVDAASAQALINNILTVDLVVSTASPKVAYRVAANCLLVGPTDYGEQVLTLQRALQLAAPSSQTELLATSSQALSLAASVLDVSGPPVRREDVAAVLPEGATLEAQSLTKWQAAPQLYSVTLALYAVAGQSLDGSLLAELRDNDLSLKISVTFAALRPTTPGETEALLRGQLRRLVEADVRAGLGARPTSQSELDAMTRTLSDAVGEHVNAARLFQDPISVGAKINYQPVSGLVTTLPSGEQIVVPTYGLGAEAPLLGTYLAVLATLGLHAAFVDWDRARARSGVLLL